MKENAKLEKLISNTKTTSDGWYKLRAYLRKAVSIELAEIIHALHTEIEVLEHEVSEGCEDEAMLEELCAENKELTGRVDYLAEKLETAEDELKELKAKEKHRNKIINKIEKISDKINNLVNK